MVQFIRVATWSFAANPVTAQQKAKLRGVRGCRTERLAGWLVLFQQRIASCQSWRCHLDRNPVLDTTPITNLSVTQGHTHIDVPTRAASYFLNKKESYKWKNMYSVKCNNSKTVNGEKMVGMSFKNNLSLINTSTVESPNNGLCLCSYVYHLCLYVCVWPFLQLQLYINHMAHRSHWSYGGTI